MYLVPGVKDNYKADDKITNDDIILFLYRNMFIATAKIKKDASGKHYHNLTSDIKNSWQCEPKKKKEDWEYKDGCEFKSYFQFQDIHKIHPLPKENLIDFFDENFNTRSSIHKVTLKEEYSNKFHHYLDSIKNNNFLKSKAWELVKYLNVPALMKEISLYNYENIHTAFFCNFISADNVYDFRKKPFEKFIKLLKKKATGENAKVLSEITKINDLKVMPQKSYPYKDGNKKTKKIIPDMSILVNNKYNIIVEGKVCASENVYEDGKNQCQVYYDNIDHNNCIFVFLTMRIYNAEIENFVNITFKDIYEEIYADYYDYNKEDILYEYLKSFCYFCNKEKFDFKIDEIPAINFKNITSELIKYKTSLKEDINYIAEYNIPNINQKDIAFYKYILVLLYNMKDFKDAKLLIEKCYNNLN